ncbi:PLPP1-like protein [Mya arenaria]|uniref:PLPP1-like protein n=1 Tax=Mya arenaria TaxID=6604 RepID=A0ABY7FNK4_MYAAR|nr:PLPP1-like protein [Mya arenaria]
MFYVNFNFFSLKFYIQRRLQVTFSRTLKIFLQFGLVFLSLICGLGRIQDNKHHPIDVIVGFLLGSSTAILVFHFVGIKVLTYVDDSDDLPSRSTNEPQDCCACGVTTPIIVEPQTPAPLLPNEYFSGMSNCSGSVLRHTYNLKLNDLPNVRRHMSTPITPSREVEDV